MGVTADPFWSIRAPADVARAAEHRPDLDGLRALAALLVVAVHTIGHVLPRGAVGVHMFFVLSGFLISGIIIRALTRANFSFGDFYSRRVRRIFPALILVILVVWIAGGLLLLPDAYQRLGKGIAAGAVFSHYIFFSHLEPKKWDLYLTDTDHGFLMVSHLWSLGIEEQFYLLWPLLMVVVWRLTNAKLTSVALSMALVASISFALAVAGNAQGDHPLLGRGVFELSIGGLLACAQVAKFRRLGEIRARLSQLRHLCAWLTHPDFIGFVALALLMLSIFGDPAPELFPGSLILVPTLGTVLFIAAGPTSYVNRVVFASKPLVAIGHISYPLYLWHLPITIFLDFFTFGQPISPWAKFGLVLPTSIALAWLTYRYVELPIRLHPKQSRVATLAGTMVVCGLLGLITALGVIRPRSFYYGGDIARAVAEDWAPGSNNVTWTWFQDAPLVLGRGTPRVLFMGDSNMQQYFRRIERLYEEEPLRARPSIFTARLGCVPGIEQLGITRKAERRACEEYIRTTLSIANNPEIDTVVIAACWYIYLSTPQHGSQFGGPAAFRPGTDAALDQLKDVLHELTSRGKKVYLVLNIPVGWAFDPRALRGARGVVQMQAVTRPTLNAHLIRSALDPIHVRLRQVAKETGAFTIDPIESLCDEQNCRAISTTGVVMYHDMWHLRPSFVRTDIHFLDAVVLQD